MTALPQRESKEIGPIVVAYDGSPESQRALLHAAAIVGMHGRITVVNVIPVQSVSSRVENVTEKQRTEQQRLLQEARALLDRRDVHASFVAAVGDPLAEILVASENAEARTIVVGRRRRRLRHLRPPLGDRLVRRTSCDVLTVH